MRHSRMGLGPRNTPTVRKFIAKAEISGFGGLAGIAQGAKGLLAGQGQFLLLVTLQGPDLALDEHLWHLAEGGGGGWPGCHLLGTRRCSWCSQELPKDPAAPVGIEVWVGGPLQLPQCPLP